MYWRRTLLLSGMISVLGANGFEEFDSFDFASFENDTSLEEDDSFAEVDDFELIEEERVTTSLSNISSLARSECHDSRFGCCPDGLHPAHGEDSYGCCSASQYGCCPDHITPASGPYDDECDCHSSKFGCCPDGIMTKMGEENDGCGCQNSPHGCCPDGRSVAEGPGNEGCDCSTFEFGCCPDGISSAKGRHFEGCKSCNSNLGCCPDGITPKRESSGETCEECQNSKFGCCFDGSSQASGLNFEGCEENPLNELATKCSRPYHTGDCNNFTIKWFYDVEWGGCNKFWFGGCGRGQNHFETEEECLSICVNPRGSGVCYLDRNEGSCEAKYSEFFYDRERKSCLPFVYRGCLGNGNRFVTKNKCEDVCGISTDEHVCSMPLAEGACSGNFQRWYFDKVEGKCKIFSYSGCSGNNNRFITEEECKNTCRKVINEIKSLRVCNLELLSTSAQDCSDISSAWAYDILLQRCVPIYKGCNLTSENGFDSWKECNMVCPTQYSPIISTPQGKYILVERSRSDVIIVPVSVKANPPATIEWSKNGISIDISYSTRYKLNSDGSLRLMEKATDFDGGIYSLRAMNGVGNAVSAEFEVIIYPLYSTVSIELEQSIFKPKTNIVISCIVKGYPPPEISWIKYSRGEKSSVIEDQTRIFLNTLKTSNLISTSTLTIRESTSKDGGTYKCVAKSPFSTTAEDEATITVQYGPGEKCVDRPSYKHCHQVIKHKFCGNKYYGIYCCRSCMEAGFLPGGVN